MQTHFRSRAWLCAAILSGVASGIHAQDTGHSWAITGATLIDGTGRPAIPAAVIAGHGDRITCAGTAVACPVDGSPTVIDAADKWIVPGLIDTHVHLHWTDASEAARAQRLRFAFGTTTTREAGTAENLEANLSHRSSSLSPESAEPRLIVSALLSDENMRRSGSTSPRDVVDTLIAAGADTIKIKQDFSAGEWRTIVEEAHAAGTEVWGHTWTDRGSRLDEALDAGIDGLSHVLTFSEYAKRPSASDVPVRTELEGWIRFKEEWNTLDRARLRAVSDRMIQQHVWFEPLLVTETHFTLPYSYPDDVAYLADVPSLFRRLRPWVPYGDASRWAMRARQQRIGRVYERMCEFVSDVHARGGVIIAGTDDEPAGPALIAEIELLATCGFSPMAALRAATAQAAVALRRPDIGTIEAGKLADLVIVDGDPLVDPSNLRQVWRVMKGGRLHDPAAFLQSLIADHAQKTHRNWEVGVLQCAGLLALTALAAAAILRIR